jgi:hypothetical protein
MSKDRRYRGGKRGDQMRPPARTPSMSAGLGADYEAGWQGMDAVADVFTGRGDADGAAVRGRGSWWRRRA